MRATTLSEMDCYQCGKQIPTGVRIFKVFLTGGEIGKPTLPTWEVEIGPCCKHLVDGPLRGGAEVYLLREVKSEPSKPVPVDWKERALSREKPK